MINNLYICEQGLNRSRTAATYYLDEDNATTSYGLFKNGRHNINENEVIYLLKWAERVTCFTREIYEEIIKICKSANLSIQRNPYLRGLHLYLWELEDIYIYNDPELIKIFEEA